ncbi:hypothetical protein E2320_006530, partial [Naja naja]
MEQKEPFSPLTPEKIEKREREKEREKLVTKLGTCTKASVLY